MFSVCVYLFISYLCLRQLVSFPCSYLSQRASSDYVVVCNINTQINKRMCFAFKLVLLCGKCTLSACVKASLFTLSPFHV